MIQIGEAGDILTIQLSGEPVLLMSWNPGHITDAHKRPIGSVTA